ncbi:hypothetical protein [Agrobacterium pusense]|uniref:hypothetical protein n=1 Tax=Agrobacterium pusense TaxID=648995 RepID=UPI001C6E2F19|nr:hypothetical protein [Agrobacterium pusense]MBW9067142.1 hypothetical protein [Agrobacterium pusense]MBW9082912.1 hypothetical protein [Agrobacterium pusense]MBW9124842.1 hypothetical protein [Agrobacterium pusense]MBW9135580.1 hypothetical protein [Agrobacterium pusense]
MKPVLVFLALNLGLAMPYAQERTAGGTLQNQASWTALQGLLEQANGNARNAHTRLNKTEACAQRGMLYAPGRSGDGCIEAHKPNDAGVNFTVIWDRLNGLSNGLSGLSANVNSINTCAASGGVFNKSTNSCSSSGARWYFVSEGGEGYRNLDQWSQERGYPVRCSGSQGIVGRLCRSASDRCYQFAYRNDQDFDRPQNSGTKAWAQLFACE